MKIFFKKIIFGLLIFSLLLPYLLFPKKAEALITVQEVGTNLFTSITNSISNAGSAISNYSNAFAKYVLDGLAYAFAKQILHMITASVVNWINTGFQGSPSFITNPGSFFLDVADQITGDFISKAGGSLESLCSPFSIDIRIALAFKYRPSIQGRYSCTLGKIITNSKDAIKNSSINGFTAGDFKQGGWPAFVSLTTEPQNNIYGAYLTAESDLSYRVAQQQARQKDEITNGKGFLSWRDPKCAAGVAAYNKNYKETHANAAVSDVPADVPGAQGGGESSSGLKSKNDCPIMTPGTTIENSLAHNLGSGVRELELASQINEIVNALVAQLVTQVLTKGLSSVSSKDSGGSSYLDQTISDINNETNPQVKTLRENLLKGVDVYRKNSIEYKKNRDDALNVMIDLKKAYEAVINCYQSKIDSPSTPDRKKAEAAEKISEINNIISTQIDSKTSNLLLLANVAGTKLSELQNIYNQASVAKTLNDLNEPSNKYAQILQSRDLIGAPEIQQSKIDLDEVINSTAVLKQDSLSKMQMCQIL